MEPAGHWRPPQHIRVVVLGLVVEDNMALLADVTDDDGSIKGLRPLGGAVEFGETREQALHREFREETGSDIEITGQWMLFENIFSHAGTTGHEIIFAAPVKILDPSFPRKESHAFMDSMPTLARWHRVDVLDKGNLPVFPAGISGALRSFGA